MIHGYAQPDASDVDYHDDDGWVTIVQPTTHHDRVKHLVHESTERTVCGLYRDDETVRDMFRNMVPVWDNDPKCGLCTRILEGRLFTRA